MIRNMQPLFEAGLGLVCINYEPQENALLQQKMKSDKVRVNGFMLIFQAPGWHHCRWESRECCLGSGADIR